LWIVGDRRRLDASSPEPKKVLLDLQDRDTIVREALDGRGPQAIWEIPD